MENITTDSSMIYGFAKAFGSWDNVIIEPDEANTILVSRQLFIELSKAKAATERVRKLHTPSDLDEYPDMAYCTQCGDYGQIIYPCDTIKALNGEQ